MSEPTRRLFFALWPADDLRRQIEHETRDAARVSDGRVIPLSNLHITLAFLGSVPESKVAAVVRCAQQPTVQPFELTLGELNWWKRQQLLCLEPVDGAAPLQKLVDGLHESLRNEGFSLERRPFRAHVTLAREVRSERRYEPIKHRLIWRVDRFELIESEPLPAGSRYSLVAT